MAGLTLAWGCKDAGGESGSGGSSGGGSAGDESGDDGGSDDAVSCEMETPGPSPIRRLSSWEYDNTIRDLLGDDSRPSITNAFPEDGAGGFDNNVESSSVSWIIANKYLLAAEEVAQRAVDNVDTLIPCTKSESECIGEFVEDWGPKAWRRPLSAAERDDMMALYTANREDFSVQLSLNVLIQAFLQSPFFLYRVEYGVGGDGDDVLALDDYEMASRLSYFLWGSMPDDALFSAAADGELSEPDAIADHARRMLDDPRAHEVIQHFHDQWLGIRRLENIDKDVEKFPEWNSDINDRQAAQARAFIDHVMFEDDATLETLLTAPYTFADDTLADFYGWDAPGGEGMKQVTPSGEPVSGVLSLGGLMSAYSNSGATNPITRGLFVRQQLLCQTPPPPPIDADTTLPTPDPNATTRELFEQHRADPACAGCHILLDPLGFGFENYDAVGRYRTTENGQPVDASGELASTDVDATFDGVVGLGALLATSEQLGECTALNWYRFAHGRAEAEDDGCNLEALNVEFAESGYDVRELLVGITQLDSFRFRMAPDAEGGE